MAEVQIGGQLVTNARIANIDGLYGPYESISAAETRLGNRIGNANCVGLTVGIKQSDGKVKEYWVQPKGTTPETYGLVEKGAGTTDYADLDNKPTISDGGQGSPQLPIAGNIKVTASAATSGQTTGVAVTAGQNGVVNVTFTLEKGEKGDTGETGPHGPQGVQGLSAFEVWKEETGRTTATGAEYIEDLQTKVVRWIPVVYEATAASASIGDTVTFTTAPSNPIDGAIVLMPNAGSGATASMMFAVSSDGQTPATYTYTYIGDLNIDTTGLLGSGDVDGTGLVNPAPNALAKATDVQLMKQQLEGITLTEAKASYTAVAGYKVSGTGTLSSNSNASYATIPLGDAKRVRFAGINLNSLATDQTDTGYCFGHYNGEETESNWVIDAAFVYTATASSSELVELLKEVPEGSTHLRTNVKYSVLTESVFYCYLHTGDTIKETIVKEIDDSLVKSNVVLNKYIHKVTGEDVTIINKVGWCYSDYFPLTASAGTIVWKGCGVREQLSNQAVILYYDANKELIGYNANIENNLEIDISERTTVAYARASFDLSYADDGVYLKNGDVIFKPVFDSNIKKAIDASISSLKENGYKAFPIKGLVQRAANKNWKISDTDDATRVCTGSIMLVPYDGVEFTVILPSDMFVRFHYGNITSATNPQQGGNANVISAKVNGDIVKIQNGYTNFRILFYGKSYETEIDVEKVKQLVDKGEIKLLYPCRTPDNVIKNIGCEANVKAAMYLYKQIAINADYKKHFLHNMPVIGHITDIHGDITRLDNAIDYCRYIGVDMILNTGDTACNRASNGVQFYNDMLPDDIPMLLCVGNHDAWYTDETLEEAALPMNYKVNRDLMQPTITKYSCSVPQSEDYNHGITYFYKDFNLSVGKIRVISLNLYEESLESWQYYGRVTQKQIDWFIDVLANTPQDYGVVLMYHSPIEAITKVENKTKFYQTLNTSHYEDGRFKNNFTFVAEGGISPICAIIDAFINKTHRTGTYTTTLSDNTTETVEWDADFTNLNSGVEFICHLTGHSHKDMCGYYDSDNYDGTGIQLCICLATLQSVYGEVHYYKANDTDVVRGGIGATEDLFNIYAIDRENGVVRIARVGSTMTSSMESRDYMVIPYRLQTL